MALNQIDEEHFSAIAASSNPSIKRARSGLQLSRAMYVKRFDPREASQIANDLFMLHCRLTRPNRRASAKADQHPVF